MHGEERIGLLAHAAPETVRFDGIDDFAAERCCAPLFTAASAPARRIASVPSRHALPVIGNGWPPHSLSLRTASVACMSNLSVASATGFGNTLIDTSQDQSERAERTRHQPRDVIAGDVLHHLAAEMQHLALAVHHHGAEHEIARRAGRGAPRAGESRRDAAAEGGVAAEMRRLERQHLAAFVERGFDLASGVPAFAVITSSAGS